MARSSADCEVPGVVLRVTQEVVPDVELVRELPVDPPVPSVREIASDAQLAVGFAAPNSPSVRPPAVPS
jgi:hypothetical protein